MRRTPLGHAPGVRPNATPLRRLVLWTVTIALLVLVFVEISVSHSQRPCLETASHPCAQPKAGK
jgi:hypothetical protein